MTLVLLVAGVLAFVAGRSVLSKKSRRRSLIDSGLHTLMRLASWFKQPRWTPGLRLAAIVAAALLFTYVTGSLFKGVAVVVLALAVYAAWSAVSWFLTRRRLTIEAGLPVSLWRMLKDAVLERQRFAKVQERWEVACAAQSSLRWAGQSPSLKRMTTTLAGDVRALVDPGALGGDIEAVVKLAPTVLPGVMKCAEVSVSPGKKPGTAWVTFLSSSPLERPVPIAELPLSGKKQISFGVHDDGSVAAVPYGRSMLVGSATGGGKSSFGWSAFTDIRRDGQPLELFVIDPKNAELNGFKDLVGKRLGNVQVSAYVRTGTEAKALFEKLTYEMHDRQELLADQGLRALETPTDRFPARLVLADELMDVSDAFKGGATSPMGIFLSQGRATMDFMIASAQQAKITTLGDCRDLYSVRAALRTMTPENTKAILGIGETDGAACSRIPLSLPGVGYYVTEEGAIRKFRTAYVSDANVAVLMAGGLPEGMLTEADLKGTPTWLYVCHSARRCEYVGIAESPRERFAQHARTDSRWCSEHDQQENWWRVHVDPKRIETKLYPSRTAAMAAEARMIRELKPYWNIVHNSDNPLSNESVSKRPGRRVRAQLKAEELIEAGRGELAIHQVKVDLRKQERVAAAVQRADEREQRVIAESWAA